MINGPMQPLPGQSVPEQPVSAVPAGQANQLVERLRDARLSARDDLSISRHVFREEASYIVHDPLSFQSHRFSRSDYEALSRLNRDATLGEVFESLKADGEVNESDEVPFYEFVLGLQARGLLDLPVTDGQRLYARHLEREKMLKKPSVMKLLFLKIPLFKPDQFLDRTVHLARPLFTKTAVVLWAILMLAAISLVTIRWSEFYQPFADLLATRNLIILFFVMTALKFWHELGHAYACKINGGAVPDMGAFLMAGMPMAYVDVSSSWSFPRRRDRIKVGLGGMYFESFAACIGVFIWAATGPGLVNSTAHFVVLMASLMTVLFNANPLMRYDGYYILSDILGIPNLRQRSTSYTGGLVKKFALGLPTETHGKSFREVAMLISYGVASTIYQYWLVLSISMMIASTYFLVGMVIACSFVFSSLIKPLAALFKYLWFHKETQPVRTRALAVSGLMIAAAVAVTAVVPVPGGVVANGQITHEKLQIVRLPYDCVLTGIEVNPGQPVDPDQTLLTVANDAVEDRYAIALANLDVSQRRSTAGTGQDPATRKALALQVEQAEREYEFAREVDQTRNVCAEFSGTVRSLPMATRIGQQIQAGEELVRIGTGKQVVRVLCSAQQMANSQPKQGDVAQLRIGSTYKTLNAVVQTVEPAGSDEVTMAGLTQFAGGDIILDPMTGRTQQPWFLVTLEIEGNHMKDVPDDLTATVRFRRQFESLGHYGWRHLRVFFSKLFVS